MVRTTPRVFGVASRFATRPPGTASARSRTFLRAPTEGDEKLRQLVERLARCAGAPGSDASVESFLRGIEVAHDDQCLPVLFLERHRGDGAVNATFVVGPDEAR